MRSKNIASINTIYFPVKKGLKILDFGFGDGSKSIVFAKEGLTVTAADISRENIIKLKNKINQEKISTVKLISNKSLPFPQNSFDRIIANEVLEHINDTRNTLSDLYRVLKKNGIICISVPTSNTENFYNILNKEYKESAGHVHIFTKKKLIGELTDVGFKIKHIEYLNFQFAIYWLIQSFFHINPTGNGTLHDKPKFEIIYWKIWGVLSVLHLSNLILLFGNKVFPKSIYIYASK